MKGIDVTAIVLTYNERDNIRYCLRSLKWCDEIIVVDSYSTDRTEEIAEEEGAKVVQRDSDEVGRFDQLRQEGIEKCSNDWVFVLDADEICPAGLARTLVRKANEGDYEVFEVPRRNYYMDEENPSAMWPDYQLRFFKHGSVNYSSELHDFDEVEGQKTVFKLDPEEVDPILHFSLQSVSDFFEGMNRYSSIYARQEAEGGYSLIKALFSSIKNASEAFIRNIIFKKGYRRPYQTSLAIFGSFIAPFIREFKKWQIIEKGTDEEVRGNIDSIRDREVSKYEGGLNG